MPKPLSLSLSLSMDTQPQPLPEPPQTRSAGGTEFSWFRSVPGGTGVTVLALLLSRPVDPSLLQTCLHHLQNFHPMLRSQFNNTGTHLSIPTLPSSQLHLRSIEAAATADLLARLSTHPDPPSVSSPFHSLLEHELNRNPWSERPDGPVFFATVYELPGPGPSWFLALRLHTAACDRTSGVAILTELMGLMGGGEGGGAFREEAGEVILGIEDLIPKGDTWKPFWARGRDLVGYSLNTLRTSGLQFEDAGPERSTEVVRLVMVEEETRKLLSACNSRGVKLCTVLVAAGLIAVYSSKNLENNRQENYAVVTLIDCRKYLDPVLNNHHVGFYHSAILNTVGVRRGEGLWEVAMRCHNAYSTSMSNKKHLTDIGELNFLMCKAIENPHLTPSSSLRTALISVFEEPVIYESTEVQRRLGVEDYVGCASVHGVGPSIAFFDTIRDGRLDCACVYPSPLHSRKQIQGLVEHMKGVLIEGSHASEESED